MNTLDHSEPTGAADDATAMARFWADLIDDRDLTTAERERFEAWLFRDPEHEREFLAAFELPFLLREIPEPVREAILSRVAMRGTPPRYLPERRRSVRRLALALVAAVVLLGVGSQWLRQSDHHQIYSTGTAEKHAIDLPDGTRVELNAQTDLESVGSKRCDRLVKLRRGEALFDVRGNPQCPFKVLVGHGTIEVLGTRFDVNQHQSYEEVSVLEGRVRVRELPAAGGAPIRQLDLGAGQQTTLGSGPASARNFDRSSVLAWREDRLEFYDQPLAQVVDELQRYTRTPLRIADPQLLAIHVTGGVQVDAAHIRDSIQWLGERPEVELRDDGHSLILTFRSAQKQHPRAQP